MKRGLALVLLGTLALAAPARAERLQFIPDARIGAMWVAPRGLAATCKGFNADPRRRDARQLTACPRAQFQPVKNWTAEGIKWQTLVVRTKDNQFRSADYQIGSGQIEKIDVMSLVE